MLNSNSASHQFRWNSHQTFDSCYTSLHHDCPLTCVRVVVCVSVWKRILWNINSCVIATLVSRHKRMYVWVCVYVCVLWTKFCKFDDDIYMKCKFEKWNFKRNSWQFITAVEAKIDRHLFVRVDIRVCVGDVHICPRYWGLPLEIERAPRTTLRQQ